MLSTTSHQPLSPVMFAGVRTAIRPLTRLNAGGHRPG